MTIIREGKEYKLTDEELWMAHMECERNSNIEELNYWLDYMDEGGEINSDIKKQINVSKYVDDYKKRLCKNDYICETINYFTMDYIKDYILPDFQ